MKRRYEGVEPVVVNVGRDREAPESDSRDLCRQCDLGRTEFWRRSPWRLRALRPRQRGARAREMTADQLRTTSGGELEECCRVPINGFTPTQVVHGTKAA